MKVLEDFKDIGFIVFRETLSGHLNIVAVKACFSFLSGKLSDDYRA